MGIKSRFSALPKNTKNLLVVGALLALVVALPLFIWGITTQKFLIFKRAASGEPSVCTPQNKEIVVTPQGENGTCHDIQTAVDSATGDGYVIRIEGGIYQPSSTVNIEGKSGLTIYPGSGRPAVQFNLSNGWGFRINSSSNIRIGGLDVYGQNTPNGLVSITNSSDVILADSDLNSDSSHTLDIQNSNNVMVVNTTVQSSAGGVEISYSNDTQIVGNKIHDTNNGITANGGSALTIAGNLLYANRESGIRIVGGISGLQIVQNTIVDNKYGNSGYPALHIATYQGSGSGYSISRNIISSNLGVGVSVEGGQIIDNFSYNDVWNNSPTNYAGYNDQTGVNGNISADPLLRVYPSTYYCPASGSPVIYGNLQQGGYMGYYYGTCGDGTSTPTPTATPFVNNCGGTCGTNYDCDSGLICYNGFCRNPACTSATSCACPVATAIPTSSPSPTRTFGILFKFDGVSDGSAAGAGVSVRFVNPAWGSKSYSTPPVITSYVGSGIYMARFSLPLLAVPFPVSDQYSIILKGEKHLGVKFCSASGQTTRCASGDTGQISIPDSAALISLNFSGVPLPAGDTYTQDGVVNAVDFARINSLLSKAYSSQTDLDKRVGDLDYNGRVDARDMLLFRKTLETRYDEY